MGSIHRRRSPRPAIPRDARARLSAIALAWGFWGICVLWMGAGLAGPAAAVTWTVGAEGSGRDFTSIQPALDAAQAGDTVVVHQKPVPYFERVAFPRSGSAVDGPITLRAAPGETPVLDATPLPPDEPMIVVDSKSHIRVIGLELQNNVDAFGIRVRGKGSHIEIRDNHIHHLRGVEAGGICVIGEKKQPYTDVVIDGNRIHDTEPARSETLVLNGNVSGFEITNNWLADNDNIGIDLIGGEADVNPDPTLVARNGVVRGNVVERSNSSYGGGYAAGIYVDGGRDIVIENNRVTGSDYGIEIAAENKGLVTSGIHVRNNVIDHNEKAGLVFGGFSRRVGRANDNFVTGNTLYHNNTLGRKGQGRYFDGNGIGELYIQFGKNNVVRNNLVVAGPENVFVAYDEKAGNRNDIDFNLYWSEDVERGKFSLGGKTWRGLDSWQRVSGQDASSQAAAPALRDPDDGDFRLGGGSSAIGAGDPATSPVGERDLDGRARRVGAAVDVGADERGPSCPGDESTGAFCSRDEGRVAPGTLLVYYGFPSLINGAAGDLDAAAGELAAYDAVVLGAGLERPAGEGGSDDHEETVEIVGKEVLGDTRIFGYVPIGVLGSNLAAAEIEGRIDDWMRVVGVDGIFLDEFGYDFCVSRSRQNAAVDYVKTSYPGAPVVANAFQPDDALGDSTDPAAPNAACDTLAGGAFAPNPDRTPSRLDANDAYLFESHQVVLGAYDDPDAWRRRAEALRRYQESMGIQVLSVTTTNGGFDQSRFDYAWYSAALYGHEATGWGEPFFSAVSSSAPFRPRPDVDPGRERIGPVELEDGIDLVTTDTGVLSVDTRLRLGEFTPFDPPPERACDPACAGFDPRLKLVARPVVAERRRIDVLVDLDGDAWSGQWGPVAVAGAAVSLGDSGRRFALALDDDSLLALYAWLDDLAGGAVAIEPRRRPEIGLALAKNGTQASLRAELPFKASKGGAIEKGVVVLEREGAAWAPKDD